MRPPSPNNIEAASIMKFCLTLTALALGMGAAPAGAAPAGAAPAGRASGCDQADDCQVSG